jgi:hypothetical protein
MRNRKGFAIIMGLVVVVIVTIIVVVASVPVGTANANADRAFQKEFGFNRDTPTPEVYEPIVRKRLDELCARYRLADEWTGEVTLEALAQARAGQQAQESYERYERAYDMAADNGFVEERGLLVYKGRTEDGGFLFEAVNPCPLYPEEQLTE